MIMKLIQIQESNTEERVLRGELTAIQISAAPTHPAVATVGISISFPSFTAVVASPPLLTCPCSQPAHPPRRTRTDDHH